MRLYPRFSAGRTFASSALVACMLATACSSGEPVEHTRPRSPLDDSGGARGDAADAGMQPEAAGTDGGGDEDTATPSLDASDAQAWADASDAPGVSDAPDAPGLSDATDAGDPATLWAGPGLPVWDGATVAHVKSVRASGLAQGNSPAVFAKMGDSITEYPPFLYDVGNGNYQLGTYGALSGAISFFSSTVLYDGSNCFNRYSDAAQAGWTSADALGPPDAVTLEISEIHPAYAIVMFGTNDLESASVAQYTSDMGTLVDQAESAGVVVVLSTIPDREDFAQAPGRVTSFNQAIRDLAASRHLPIVDLFTALSSLPGSGLGPDEVHPSVEPEPDGGISPADFTAAGLQYGFDVRNLLTIEALDRLRGIP